MLIEYSLRWFQTHVIAEALSLFRLVAALVIAALVIVDSHPMVALVLLVLAALSDVYDGKAARRWHSPEVRWHGRSGKFSNDLASGVLANALLGSIWIRLLIVAIDEGWSASSIVGLLAWTAGCAIAGLLTLHYNKGKEQLVPLLAEKAEVDQGHLQGWILALSGLVLATGIDGWVNWQPALWVQILVGLLLAVASWILVNIIVGDRMYARTAERKRGDYKGTKLTWEQVKLFGK